MEHTFFAVKCLQICLSNKHRNIYYIVCELYFKMNTLWKKIIKYILEKVKFLLSFCPWNKMKFFSPPVYIYVMYKLYNNT